MVGTGRTRGTWADAVELATAPTVGTGRPRGTLADAVELTTVPAQRTGVSAEAPRLLEDTLHPAAARPASARAPSAATLRAERQGAIRRAEAPALVAADSMVVAVAVDSMVAAVVAGIGNCRFILFWVDCEI